MPTREEVAYFGAGPAPLPTPVLAAGAEAFLNFESTGLSLAEISHRSATANKIVAESKAALVSLLDIPDNYEILFMHGGGSAEFSAVVFNMVAVWVERRRRRAKKDLAGDEQKVLERVKREVQEELRLDYLVTGSWSLKASQEAAELLEPLGKGLINVALDSRGANREKFGSIPDESTWKLTPSPNQGGKGSAFVYYCDNETVDGVEFARYPKILEPSSSNSDDERLVVVDMSSNFLSRRVDVSRYAVIFVRLPSLFISHVPIDFHIGRRAKKHRHHRHHASHRPKRSPRNRSPIPLPPRRRGLVPAHDPQLACHSQKQLLVQHYADLQHLDRRPSHALPAIHARLRKARRARSSFQREGENHL